MFGAEIRPFHPFGPEGKRRQCSAQRFAPLSSVRARGQAAAMFGAEIRASFILSLSKDERGGGDGRRNAKRTYGILNALIAGKGFKAWQGKYIIKES